jgi:hypothetical protein
VSGESTITRVDQVEATPPYDRVLLNACVDVSAVSLVDRNGISQVSPDRPDVQSTSIVLTEDHSPTGYLITEIVGAELDPPC